MVILFHQQIVVVRRKESSHLGVPPRNNLLPTRAKKNPCQPLLGFLNGLVGYKCCQPTIVCSAILSAIVFKFFCMLSILLAGLVIFILFYFFFNLSKLCLSSVSSICMYFLCIVLFWCIMFDPWAKLENSVYTELCYPGKRSCNKINKISIKIVLAAIFETGFF